jgi:hydrogenase nickel incorporation protein HypA/HybF
MHELSVARSIIAIAAQAAGGRKIRRVTVEIGRLSGILADAVAFCFSAAAEGTALTDATLAIIAVEGRGRCRHCGAETAMPTLHHPCACGSYGMAVIAGEEMTVKAIEVEES